MKTTKRTKIPITFNKCGKDGLNYTNVEEITRLGLDNYWCPTINNITIGGVYYSSEYDYIEIKIAKCKNSSSSPIICQPSATIDSAILGSFNVVFISRYFEINDYDNPVKSYISQYFYNIVPSLKKKSDVKI